MPPQQMWCWHLIPVVRAYFIAYERTLIIAGQLGLGFAGLVPKAVALMPQG